jgi:hypothetical protein
MKTTCFPPLAINLMEITELLGLLENSEVSPGQLTALCNNGVLNDLLSADLENVDRNALRKALGLTPVVLAPEIFKTVRIDLPASYREYIAALRTEHCFVSNMAKYLLRSSLRWAELVEDRAKEEFDLVRLSNNDLGVSRDASPGLIRSIGLSLGLNDCPDGIGAALRFTYRDQPAGEKLVVVSGLLEDVQDWLLVSREEKFGKGHRPKLLLEGYRESKPLLLGDESGYAHDYQWVFLKPRDVRPSF